MFVEFCCFNKINKLYAKIKETRAIFFLDYALRKDMRAGVGAGPNVGPNAGVLLGPTGYTFTVLA